MLADAKASGAIWIATTEYRTYANLLWHLGGRMPVIQINERAFRFLDFAPLHPAQFTGKALYVHFAAASPLVAAARVTTGRDPACHLAGVRPCRAPPSKRSKISRQT